MMNEAVQMWRLHQSQLASLFLGKHPHLDAFELECFEVLDLCEELFDYDNTQLQKEFVAKQTAR